MRNRTQHQGRRIIFFLATLLILILFTAPSYAQEATPELSGDVTPTETAIPTEIIPTEVTPPVASDPPLEPTVEVTPSEVPSVEPTEITPEVTSEIPEETPSEIPSETPSATPSATETAEPVVELPRAFTTNFDASFPLELGAGIGWLPVTLDAGQAIQYSDGAEAALYTLSTFTDSAAEAKVLLNSGEVMLSLRKTATEEYSAVLAADGTLKLNKNGQLINAGTVTLTPGVWITLKFTAVGGEMNVLVDGVVIVSATDLAPLSTGQAGFTASAGSLVRLDNFAIYGTGDGVPVIVTSPEATPEITPEATLEVTAEVTAEATDEANLSVFSLASVTCPAIPSYIRAASQNNAGTQANTPIDANNIDGSEDSRYVIFEMNDSTLTAEDTNGVADVFRFDRDTCSLARVSVADGGAQPDAASHAEHISDDGRYILFRSAASNLLASAPATITDHIYLRDMNTGVNILVSVDSSGTAGNGQSYRASMSSNARYVVFTSRASNLVAGDTNDFCDNNGDTTFTENCADVFVRDTAGGTTGRVSVADGGGQADGPSSLFAQPVISDNGAAVAFVSFASNLTAQGVNNCSGSPQEPFMDWCAEVYWNNGSVTKRVSIAANNLDGQNDRLNGTVIDMSSNGQYVVFSSLATNLVAIDTNGVADVFMRDTTADTTALVSLADNEAQLDAASGSASISENGDRVGFITASNTVLGMSGNSKSHLYIRSLSGSQTTRISQSVSGVIGNDNTNAGRIADGGNYAVFSSVATNLVAGDTNSQLDIFVSGIVFGTPPPVVPSGLIAFSSTQTAITLRFTDNSADETNFRVERNVNNAWVEIGTAASLPGTGGLVNFVDNTMRCGQIAQYRVRAFRSSDGQYSPYSDVLIASKLNCAAPPACNPNLPIARISTGPNGAPQSLGESFNPSSALSGDAQYGVFASVGNNLAAGDVDFITDIFRYNRATCQNELVSVGHSQGNLNEPSSAPSISVDGLFVAFASLATDAVGVDTNGQQDIFVRDMQSTTTQLISKNGTTQADQPSFEPHISANGNFVVFATAATNLNGADNNGLSDIYLYNRTTEVLSLVSFDVGGTAAANGDSSRPFVVVMGGNPYVVFYSTATNLVAGDTNGVGDVFIRDMNGAVTYRISLDSSGNEAIGGVSRPALAVTNETNIYVVFDSLATNLFPSDTVATCNSDGDADFNDNCFDVLLRTVPVGSPGTGTTTLISRAGGVAGAAAGMTGVISLGSFAGSVSVDGRYVVFQSGASNLVVGDTNNKQDVFVRDTVLNTTMRLGNNGNDSSSNAAIAPFGTYIVFTSLANNLVTGDTNNFCQLDLDPQLEECADIFLVPVSTALIGNPSTLTATTNLPNQINLSWAAIANVDGYEIWRDSGTGMSLLGTTTAATYIDNWGAQNMLCSNTAQYKVRGYRSTGGYFTAFTNMANGATTPCTKPVLTAPATGTQSQGALTLQWNPIANTGDQYQVLISTDAAGTFPMAGYPQIVTTNAHTLDPLLNLLPDGTYYWKVRAYNSTINDFYGPFSLSRTFIIDTVPLDGVPIPLTPISNNTVNTARPTFTWTPVTGAAFYQLEINTDENFGAVPAYVSPDPGTPGAITTTSFTIPAAVQALPQADYYWTVRAYDRAMNPGDYSFETPRFVVGLMTAPVNNAVIKLVGTAISAPVTFTWTGVAGATGGYQVQLDSDEDGEFDDAFCNPVPVTALTCTRSGVSALPAGIYAWRVVLNSQTSTDDHPSRIFTITPSLPPAPGLVSPAANSVFGDYSPMPSYNLIFDWNDVPSASSYTLEIDNSPTFNTILEVNEQGLLDSVTTTPIDMSFYLAGTYYWRVRSVNALGVAGPPSAARSFKLDFTEPATPGQTLPANGAVVNSVRPTFTWTQVTDPSAPVRYVVEISTADEPDFDANFVTDFVSTTTTGAPTVNLPAQGVYYWRVIALDRADNFSDPNPIRSFTVNISNTPAANAVLAAGNINFTWAGVPTATAYRVEIEPANAPDFLTPDFTCPTAGGTVTTLNCARTLTTGAYVWRVVATAGQAITNNPDIYRHLYVGNTASLPAPTNVRLDGVTTTGTYKTDIYVNQEEKTNGIHVVWNAPAAVAGLTIEHYIVQFAPTSAFSTIIDTVTTPDGLTTNAAIPASVLALDGTNKYARVRAQYAPGTVNSANTAAFWFVVDTQAPNAPNVLLPAPSLSSKVTPKPKLTWSAVTGIAPTNGYLLDVATNFALTTPALPGYLNFPVSAASYTFPSELPLGQLFWRVRAVDVAGNISATTATSRGDFMVFLGTAPVQSAINQPVRPTFTWTTLTSALGYTLEVARDGDTSFTGDVYTVSGSASTLSHAYPMAQPPLSGIIYWRVFPTGVTPPAGYYAAFSVTGGLNAPTLNPAHTVINNSEYATAQLSWNAPTLGTGVYTYDIEVASNTSFTGAVRIGHSPASNATTLNLSPAMDAQADGLKYWRVRAVYMPGNINGPYSATGTFTLDRTAPAKPVGLKVTFGTNPSRPTLGWTAVAGVAAANGYEIDLSEDSGFSTHVTGFPKSVSTPSSAIVAPLTLKQKTYYFVVRAIDAAGNFSADSDTFSYDVNIAKLSANNAVVNAPTGAVNQVFSWFAVPGATSYQVEIDGDNDGDFIDSVITCPAAGTTTATSCTVPGLARGTYAWRVVADGNAPGAGILRTLFVINGTTLPAPTGVVMSEFGSMPPYYQDNYLCICEVLGGADLEWLPPAVIGAQVVSYDVQYSTTPTFTTLLATDYSVLDLFSPVPPEATDTDGVKYVRVRARYLTSVGEQPGAFTAAKRFTVDTVYPGMPRITAPTEGQIITTRTPTLRWTAVPGAARYYVELYSFSGIFPIIETEVTTTSITVPNVLGLENDIYFWLVIAIDTAGNWGDPTEFYSFEVAAP
jgi:hypothetical protein